jgi:hypothetical protein
MGDDVDTKLAFGRIGRVDRAADQFRDRNARSSGFAGQELVLRERDRDLQAVRHQ